VHNTVGSWHDYIAVKILDKNEKIKSSLQYTLAAKTHSLKGEWLIPLSWKSRLQICEKYIEHPKESTCIQALINSDIICALFVVEDPDYIMLQLR
jgi:hypothetical protein